MYLFIYFLQGLVWLSLVRLDVFNLLPKCHYHSCYTVQVYILVHLLFKKVLKAFSHNFMNSLNSHEKKKTFFLLYPIFHRSFAIHKYRLLEMLQNDYDNYTLFSQVRMMQKVVNFLHITGENE